MAHTTLPALHADDVVALVEDTQLDGLLDAPLETTVNVFLPDGGVEVGLLFGEQEWVDASVKVGVLYV